MQGDYTRVNLLDGCTGRQLVEEQWFGKRACDHIRMDVWRLVTQVRREPAEPETESLCVNCGKRWGVHKAIRDIDGLSQACPLGNGWATTVFAPSLHIGADKPPLAESEALAATFSEAASKPEADDGLKAILAAAGAMDWDQPQAAWAPCFAVQEDGHFCGRAPRWHDGPPTHEHVSLATLLATVAELGARQMIGELGKEQAAWRKAINERDALRAELDASLHGTRTKRLQDERDALLADRAADHQEVEKLRAELAKAVERATCWDDDLKTRITWEQLAEKRSQQLAEVTQQRDSHLGVCRSIARKVREVYRGDDFATLEQRVQWVCDALKKLDAGPTPPAESYRLLEHGEIVQEGDEFSGVLSGEWLPVVAMKGCTVNHRAKYRRPITGGAGLYEAATCDQRAVGGTEAEWVEGKPNSDCDDVLIPPDGILPRIEKFEECGLLLSELPIAEARLVLSALTTVFSA